MDTIAGFLKDKVRHQLTWGRSRYVASKCPLISMRDYKKPLFEGGLQKNRGLEKI
jgi:hypothetical protein